MNIYTYTVSFRNTIVHPETMAMQHPSLVQIMLSLNISGGCNWEEIEIHMDMVFTYIYDMQKFVGEFYMYIHT